jgi:Tripartite tricarboxylate transporter TctB family
LLSRKKVEVLFSVGIVSFLVWAIWEARQWPPPSKLFPWSLAFTVLTLALLHFALAWRGALKENTAGNLAAKRTEDANASATTGRSDSESLLISPEIARQRAIVICCWIVAFFIGISLLGFKLGSLFLTFMFLKFTARESWTISAAIAVANYLFFWLVFDIALRTPLGSGLLGDYFGIN